MNTDLPLREEYGQELTIKQPHTGSDRENLGSPSLSDTDLAEQALSAIRQRSTPALANIRATIRAGWLILEGEVENPRQKQIAEEAVRHLPQIRGISNNITVGHDALARRVSQTIDEKFAASAHLSAHRILVAACDHKITLFGHARSRFESEEAEAAAWLVPGVSCVVNRIRLAT